MKFLLFNVIVAGALVYLFSGADLPGAAARQSVDEAMARLTALSERAAEDVEKMAEVPAGPASQVAMEGPVTPSPSVPDRTVPETEVSVPAAPIAAPPESAPLPERQIEAVPVYRVPTPGTSGPVVASPAEAPIEIAEPMMSSQDRRKELFSLAQEMELMYANRVGQ